MFRKILYFIAYIFVEWRKLGIEKEDIVADFGCGGRPLLRADILIDKFLKGLDERPTEFLDTGAYIIQCDLEKLPFKSKSIDFAYSSHTIEHIENIGGALDEMSRVAKRGYITCPSAMRESMMSHRTHLWYIQDLGDGLRIEKKVAPYTKYIGDFGEKLEWSKNAYFWYRFESYFHKEFIVDYFWEQKIRYSLDTAAVDIGHWEKSEETIFKPQKGFLLFCREIIIKLSSKIARYFQSNKQFNIKDILCCPFCYGGFKYVDNKCICQSCKREFRSKDNRIFYLKAPIEE